MYPYPHIEQNSLIFFRVVLSMVSLLEGNSLSLAFGSVTNQGAGVISSVTCLPPTTDGTGTLSGQQRGVLLSAVCPWCSRVSDSGGHSLLGICLLEWMRYLLEHCPVYLGWTYIDFFFNLSVIIPCVAFGSFSSAIIIIRAGDVSYSKNLNVAVTTPTSAQGGQMPFVCT